MMAKFYRSDKAALLAAMQSTGASTRGIRVLLRKLSSLAGNLLHLLFGLGVEPVSRLDFNGRHAIIHKTQEPLLRQFQQGFG